MSALAFRIGDRVRVPARNTHGAQATGDGEIVAVHGNGDYGVSSPDYALDDGTRYTQTVFGEDLERTSRDSAEMAAALDADIKKLDALRHAERRERIATAALQGFLASSNHSGTATFYAELATECADALIAALDKPEGAS